MSVKPILFNTEIVRAILDGRKTCTRRILKGAIPFDEKAEYWNVLKKRRMERSYMCRILYETRLTV